MTRATEVAKVRQTPTSTPGDKEATQQLGMAAKEEGVFVTQKGKRRGGEADDAVDADQLEEMVAGVAQTSQSTLLLKKKKEMREVV